MVRAIRAIAMFLAALVALPSDANATLFHVNIFADVTGTETLANCGPGQVFPYCPLETLPFQTSISRDLGYLDLLQGANAFQYGSPYSTGYITGTITNDNGFLTGSNLYYSQGAFCHGFCGYDYNGTAATFLVTGGVPEPETWAMLLIGIGAVAWAMRRRRWSAVPLVEFAT